MTFCRPWAAGWLGITRGLGSSSVNEDGRTGRVLCHTFNRLAQLLLRLIGIDSLWRIGGVLIFTTLMRFSAAAVADQNSAFRLFIGNSQLMHRPQSARKCGGEGN